jgi:hypothetical protein
MSIATRSEAKFINWPVATKRQPEALPQAARGAVVSAFRGGAPVSASVGSDSACCLEQPNWSHRRWCDIWLKTRCHAGQPLARGGRTRISTVGQSFSKLTFDALDEAGHQAGKVKRPGDPR